MNYNRGISRTSTIAAALILGVVILGTIVGFTMLTSSPHAITSSPSVSSSSSSSSTKSSTVSSLASSSSSATNSGTQSQQFMSYAIRNGTDQLSLVSEFRAAGLYWIVFNDFNPNANYGPTTYLHETFHVTSSDGVNWSPPIADANFSSNAVTDFDGTYLQAAYLSNFSLVYMRGMPSATGMINWSQPSETVLDVNESQGALYLNSIAVDSSDNPWLTMTQSMSLGPGSPADQSNYFVVRSSTNNGSFHVAPGFPYFVGSDISRYESGGINLAPLSSGRLAMVVCSQSIGNYIRTWNGSSWSAETTSLPTGTSCGFGLTEVSFLSSLQTSGDNLTMLYTSALACPACQPYDGNLSIITYTYGSNSVKISGIISNQPTLGFNPVLLTLSDKSYVFWLSTNATDVYYVYGSGSSPGGSNWTLLPQAIHLAGDNQTVAGASVFLGENASSFDLFYVLQNEVSYEYTMVHGIFSPPD